MATIAQKDDVSETSEVKSRHGLVIG